MGGEAGGTVRVGGEAGGEAGGEGDVEGCDTSNALPSSLEQALWVVELQQRSWDHEHVIINKATCRRGCAKRLACAA
jgi:hypothetical protein